MRIHHPPQKGPAGRRLSVAETTARRSRSARNRLGTGYLPCSVLSHACNRPRRARVMFGRGRSRRAYRVYAEDELPGVEDPEAEIGAFGDPTFDGKPSYTAAPRGLPRSLDGRVGLALVTLVAMAVSALVVHAL